MMDHNKPKTKEITKTPGKDINKTVSGQSDNPPKVTNTRTIIATELQTKKNVQVVLNEKQQAKIAEFLSRKISGLSTPSNDAEKSKNPKFGDVRKKFDKSYKSIKTLSMDAEVPGGMKDDEKEYTNKISSVGNDEMGEEESTSDQASAKHLFGTVSVKLEETMESVPMSDERSQKDYCPSKLSEADESSACNFLSRGNLEKKSKDAVAGNNEILSDSIGTESLGLRESHFALKNDSDVAKDKFCELTRVEDANDNQVIQPNELGKVMFTGSQKEIKNPYMCKMPSSCIKKVDILSLRKKVIKKACAAMNTKHAFYKKLLTELFYLKNGKIIEYFSEARDQSIENLMQFLQNHDIDSDSLNLYVSEGSNSVHIDENGAISNRDSIVENGECRSVTSQLSMLSDSTEPARCAASGPVAKSPSLSGKLKSAKSMVSKKPAMRNLSTVASTPPPKGNLMEKARQEAYVIQRVAELRRQGLWVEKRLPKVSEPTRLKAHWDYLLEEMVWLSVDFSQERKWKKSAAKKVSRMVQKYFQNKANAAIKAEREQKVRLVKIASFMAKEVRMFWTNVEKLVEYKQQARLERKRKKVFDMHLNFIVSQTEKYSSWLAEGMTRKSIKDGREDKGLTRPRTRQASKDMEDPKDFVKAECKDTSESNADQLELGDIQSDQPLTIHDYVKLPDLDDSNDSLYCPSSDSGESSSSEEEYQFHNDKVEAVTELMDIEADKDLPVSKVLEKYSNDNRAGFFSPGSDSSSSESDSGEEGEEPMDADDSRRVKKEGCDPNIELSDGDSSEENSLKLDGVSSVAEGFQPKGNTLSTTDVVTNVPFLLKNKLREYQHIGLDWLVALYDKKLNGILADEMGLGKTIQTIALLAHLACEKYNWGPHLVIVPTSVIVNWEIEFKKWCPAFKILTYYGSVKDRKMKRVGWTKPNAFHICITSYKLVIQDHAAFRRKKWNYMILDEAQNIKNFKSQRWQLLLNFQTERRLLLTGTPLQNDLMELWSLMHFLMPNLFQSHAEFKEWFSNPLTGIVEGTNEYNSNIVRRLHKVLRPFILRRLKSEVEKQLPKKIEHVMLCRLSNRQRFLYDDFMSRARTKETLSSGNLLSVINVLMQLRKVCNHPDLFDPRPTVSPFVCAPVHYTTASLAVTALEYDPAKSFKLSSLNLDFATVERFMQASEAHMLVRLRPPENLDADVYTALPPVCPRERVKLSVQLLGRCITWNQLKNHNSDEDIKLNETMNLLRSIANYRLVIKHQGVMRTVTLGQLLQIHQADNNHPISPGPVSLHVKKTNPPSVILPPNMFGTSCKGLPGIGVMPPPLSHKVPRSRSQPKVIVARAGKIRLCPSRFKPHPKPDMQLPENINFGFISMGQSGNKTSDKLPAVPTRPISESRLMRGTRKAPKFRSIFAQHKKRVMNSVPHKRKMKLLNAKLAEYMKEYRENSGQLGADWTFLGLQNMRRCQQCPIYGVELREVCSVVKLLGQISAEEVSLGGSRYWDKCSAVLDMVYTPESLLDKMQSILQRYLLYVPAVTASPISLHAAHLPSSYTTRWSTMEQKMLHEVHTRLDLIHPILSAHKTQFPDLRLIQYDCGKLQLLDTLLKQLRVDGHRALIFTQMTRMLDILEMFLNYHGYRYLRLDGTTKVERRQTLMERFNSDPRIFCFILSTRSGGVGVNLTGADTVIFYDSDWNPTMDAQAQDRCHRIGQTRNVHIYRLISEKTVEENILKKAYQKRLLSDLAIEGGNFTSSHFKKQSLHDIFEVSKDSDSESVLMEMVAKTQKGNMEAAEKVLEKAFSLAEDESDVNAARLVQAEVAADFAEFDETCAITEAPELMTKKEKKVMQLVEQLTNIEKYAMRFVESDSHNFTVEKIALAEAELEQQKKEWETERIKALREEEQRVKEVEEEELLTYSAEDASNQVKKLPKGQHSLRHKSVGTRSLGGLKGVGGKSVGVDRVSEGDKFSVGTKCGSDGNVTPSSSLNRTRPKRRASVRTHSQVSTEPAGREDYCPAIIDLSGNTPRIFQYSRDLPQEDGIGSHMTVDSVESVERASSESIDSGASQPELNKDTKPHVADDIPENLSHKPEAVQNREDPFQETDKSCLISSFDSYENCEPPSISVKLLDSTVAPNCDVSSSDHSKTQGCSEMPPSDYIDNGQHAISNKSSKLFKCRKRAFEASQGKACYLPSSRKRKTRSGGKISIDLWTLDKNSMRARARARIRKKLSSRPRTLSSNKIRRLPSLNSSQATNSDDVPSAETDIKLRKTRHSDVEPTIATTHDVCPTPQSSSQNNKSVPLRLTKNSSSPLSSSSGVKSNDLAVASGSGCTKQAVKDSPHSSKHVKVKKKFLNRK